MAESVSGCPVFHGNINLEQPTGTLIKEFKGMRAESPIFWNEDPGYWIVLKADYVREIFQNGAVFSSESITPNEPNPEFKWIPGNTEAPKHVEYRQILNKAFGPKAVEKFEPMAREYARSIAESLKDQGGCEFNDAFAGVFPVRIFLEMINYPWELQPKFARISDTIFNGIFGLDGCTMDDTLGAMKEIRDFFEPELAERHANPRDPDKDFLQFVMNSTIQGEPISDDDVLNMFNQLVLAGLDTVKSQLGYAFLHLATHPEDRQRIIDNPELIPSANEEFLRAYPLVMDGRKVREDINFHGVEMKAGQMVQLVLVSATHDEDAFENADEVIIDRAKNNHLAFGAGPHRCMGSHLTRMEMRVALEEWHKVIPNYELAVPLSEIRERGGQLSLRGLPLKWST